MKAHVVLDREVAAMVHAVCESYGADDEWEGNPVAETLGRAIEPLREVITAEEAQDAREELKAAWSQASAD